MAIDRQVSAALQRTAEPSQASAPPRTAALARGGVEGNRLLTAQTGAALALLLAVLGVTILRVGQLLSVHMFVGMLLIPPVLLKLGSTGYRFTRYYARHPRYRSAGPPAPLMRAIAPVVVLSTVVVFGSGVALLLAGPSSSLRGALMSLHKASFVVWIVFAALHVVGHLAEMPRALGARWQRRLSGLTGLASDLTHSLPGMRRAATVDAPVEWDAHGTGRVGRALSLAGALVAGLVLAVVSISSFGPWLHSAASFVDR